MNKKDKEKISFIVLENGHVLGEGEGGGDIVFKQLFRFLPEKFEIKVVLPPIARTHWEKIADHPSILFLPDDFFPESTNYFKIGINYLWRSYKCFRLLNGIKSKHKIFLYSSTETISDVLPAFFCKVIKPRQYFWIVHCHHIVPSPFQRSGGFLHNVVSYFLYQLSLLCIRSADLILAVNEKEAGKLRRLKFSNRKVEVSPPGINIEEIQRLLHVGTKRKDFSAIFVGRLHPVKGVFDLPEIWQKVIAVFPKAKIAIVGKTSPQSKKKLDNLFREEEVPKERYRIFDFVPERKKYTLLSQSKMFLFLDHEAGWGIAPAEAMALGLPVVGYDIGILGNVFKKGYLKTLPFNKIKFADQVIRLLRNSNLYRRLHIEALEQTKELDVRKVGKKFADLLDQAAQKE